MKIYAKNVQNNLFPERRGRKKIAESINQDLVIKDKPVYVCNRCDRKFNRYTVYSVGLYFLLFMLKTVNMQSSTWTDTCNGDICHSCNTLVFGCHVKRQDTLGKFQKAPAY